MLIASLHMIALFQGHARLLFEETIIKLKSVFSWELEGWANEYFDNKYGPYNIDFSWNITHLFDSLKRLYYAGFLNWFLFNFDCIRFNWNICNWQSQKFLRKKPSYCPYHMTDSPLVWNSLDSLLYNLRYITLEY